MLSSSYRCSLALAIVAALAAGAPALAQDAGAPGATAESVLALGRRPSPALPAVALDTAAIAAETEITRAETEQVRLEGDRRSAAARLNGLLARPPGAPFTEPRRLRQLPPAEPQVEVLVERARVANPRLFAGAAEVRSAE